MREEESDSKDNRECVKEREKEVFVAQPFNSFVRKSEGERERERESVYVILPTTLAEACWLCLLACPQDAFPPIPPLPGTAIYYAQMNADYQCDQ